MAAAKQYIDNQERMMLDSVLKRKLDSLTRETKKCEILLSAPDTRLAGAGGNKKAVLRRIIKSNKTQIKKIGGRIKAIQKAEKI